VIGSNKPKDSAILDPLEVAKSRRLWWAQFIQRSAFSVGFYPSFTRRSL